MRTASFVDLPHQTGRSNVVANFEGTVNEPTLTCNVTNEMCNQVTTVWSVANFKGEPATRGLVLVDPDGTYFSVSGHLRSIVNLTITYQNRITIVNWTSALDGVTLFCGTGGFPERASVSLRVYSKK